MTLSARLDRLAFNRIHWLVLVTTSAAMMFDGFDSQSLSFALPLIKKQWHLSPALLGALASYSFIGLLVGSLAIGAIADRLGRRRALTISILVFSAFSGFSALAPSYGWLAAARVLTGLGLGGLIPVGAAWLSEFVPARLRAFATSAAISAFLLGWVVASAVALAVIPPFGWRAIFVAGLVPALLAIVIQVFTPESPRWLLLTGRTVEAEAIVRRLENRSGTPAPSAPLTFEEPETDAKSNWAELFTPRFRRNSVILAILFFFIQIFVYGMSSWVPTLLVSKGFTIAHSYTYTLLINIGPFAGSIVMGWLLDVIGRKTSFIVFWALGAVAVVVFAYSSTPLLIVIVGFAANFFAVATNVCLDTVTAEIYPTRLRASSVGWGLGIGRIGAIAGPNIGGLILSLSIPYAGFFVIFAIPLVINIAACIPLRFLPSRVTLEHGTPAAADLSQAEEMEASS